MTIVIEVVIVLLTGALIGLALGTPVSRLYKKAKQSAVSREDDTERVAELNQRMHRLNAEADVWVQRKRMQS